jgi:hypothetical protein
VRLTTNTDPFTGNLLEFPDQYMFLTHGPWVSDAMYLAQGAAALAAALLYAVCLRPAAAVNAPAPDVIVRRAA